MTIKTILKLLEETFSEWSRHKAPRLGAALAYYTTLSLAPLVVVMIGLAGIFFGQEAARGQLVWQIQDLVGRDAAKAIEGMVKSAQTPSSGILATVIGTLTLLFGASVVFGELRDALNTVWGVPASEGLNILGEIRYRFFSFAMVLAVGFLLLVSLVLSTALAAIGKFFGSLLPTPEYVLHIANILLSFAVVTLLFALIYKVVPDVAIAWNDVWIGAAATSLLFSIGKFLIGLYLGKASVGSAYGAAGSLVVILVWVYYSAQIFFFGAEFTQVYANKFGSHLDHSRRNRGRKDAATPGRQPTITDPV